ncbi:hypothetical protein RclHR1_06290007 [Rhizophagus clarus]|uniref:Uncharacterized protein n=1 Tax=Rhizophagus clarus TaxID=94130 RepID=A0A2Z6S9F2_9GLOM|nr:hypothetical protein RclHR1_06290007 [Rhizophagus clarus]GES83255.1 hypothetical protein GLOIN_2v1487101 [Rhizophagus clarus]
MRIIYQIAQKKGYNVTVPGTHKKLYWRWKLPDITDANFKNDFLLYSINELDQIIRDGIEDQINGEARSDSGGAPSTDFNDPTDNK